ncbi:MAG TPA: hypothetical protein VGX92_04565 [Pyrinomonadaceae bacterium]|nr:hypothetical protein [Pyrinomonadaceae bacterium]
MKRRFIPAAWLVLYALMLSSASQANAQEMMSTRLSNSEKSEIIESVLQQELSSQQAEFDSAKILSSENIEFIEPSQISEYGFILLSGAQIEERKKKEVIDYVVFRRIEVKGNIIIVSLSRMREGSACFNPKFSSGKNFIYEYHWKSGNWIGGLTGKSLPFLYNMNLHTEQWAPRTKPNNSFNPTPR